MRILGATFRGSRNCRGRADRVDYGVRMIGLVRGFAGSRRGIEQAGNSALYAGSERRYAIASSRWKGESCGKISERISCKAISKAA